MIDTPVIVESEAQAAAVVRLTVPESEMVEVMGPAIGELMEAVGAQGIGPAGPLFAHYLRIEGNTFDFELGVPVTGPVTPAGRVTAGALPAAKVARTLYVGPYEELGEAWGEFDAWLAANGHTVGPTLWERYLAGPESSADPAEWRTELNRPLAG